MSTPETSSSRDGRRDSNSSRHKPHHAHHAHHQHAPASPSPLAFTAPTTAASHRPLSPLRPAPSPPVQSTTTTTTTTNTVAMAIVVTAAVSATAPSGRNSWRLGVTSNWASPPSPRAVAVVEAVAKGGALTTARGNRPRTGTNVNTPIPPTTTAATTPKGGAISTRACIDLEQRSSQGLSPLQHAVCMGAAGCARALIEGEGGGAAGYSGETALHLAVAAGFLEIVRLMLSSESGRAEINTKSVSAGDTPLHLAADESNLQMASLLLSHGAEVNTTNNEGMSPLHVAAKGNLLALVSLLVENGATVMAADAKGMTPLHHAAAAQWPDTDILSFLIKHGARLDAVDSEGRQPLDLASKANNDAKCHVLVSNGADVGLRYRQRQKGGQQRLTTSPSNTLNRATSPAPVQSEVATTPSAAGPTGESLPDGILRCNRWGFIVSSEQTEGTEQEDLKSEQRRAKKERERSKKWSVMVVNPGAWDVVLKKDPGKIRRRVHKGIPSCMRGIAWQLLTRSPVERRSFSPEFFANLQVPNSPWVDQIDLDINRAFRTHSMFAERYGPGQTSLFNILKAYSNYDKEVGYCFTEDHQILTNRGFLSLVEFEEYHDDRGALLVLATATVPRLGERSPAACIGEEHGWILEAVAKFLGVDGSPLRVASYVPGSKGIRYEKHSRLVVNPESVEPQTIVLFEEAAEATRRKAGKDARGDAGVSLEVTGGHTMYAQLGHLDSKGSFVAQSDEGGFAAISAESLCDEAPSHCRFASAAPAGLLDGDPTLHFATSLRLDTEDKVSAFLELFGHFLLRGEILFDCNAPVELRGQACVMAPLIHRLGLSTTSHIDESGIVHTRDPLLVSVFALEFAGVCGRQTYDAWPVPSWVWRLGSDRLRPIVDGLLCPGEDTVCTSSEPFRDDVVRLAILAGHGASFSCVDDGTWIVRVIRCPSPSAFPVLATRTEIKKDLRVLSGRTWCVTVPSGHVIARRVLRDADKVVLASRPVVTGNCQSMADIAGFLLMFMQEEESFWTLVQLLNSLKYNMKGFFLPGFPALHAAFYVQTQLVRKYLPKLHAHFEKEQVRTIFYAPKWFMVMFLGVLPIDLCLRIWDAVLHDGVNILFTICLRILEYLQKSLLAMSFEQIMLNLTSLMHVKADPDSFMEFVTRNPVHADLISKLQQEYRAEAAREAAPKPAKGAAVAGKPL